jgi:hypothetical protein
MNRRCKVVSGQWRRRSLTARRLRAAPRRALRRAIPRKVHSRELLVYVRPRAVLGARRVSAGDLPVGRNSGQWRRRSLTARRLRAAPKRVLRRAIPRKVHSTETCWFTFVLGPFLARGTLAPVTCRSAGSRLAMAFALPLLCFNANAPFIAALAISDGSMRRTTNNP